MVSERRSERISVLENWTFQRISVRNGRLPVAIYRATDAILNSNFGHFFRKGVLDLILIVGMVQEVLSFLVKNLD